jgi:N-methylhydantoinase A
MGGGYALKLPVVDLSEIGAGGGSLISIDGGGLLRVGPESAGSMPGPVAYDLGGEQPTFTDAVLMLGYLNPDHLTGGALRLNSQAARRAFAEKVAKPLLKPLLEAAYGVYEVACGGMIRAVKAVSTYRGRDPREFTLFAFGGNGAVVAAHLADLLEMRRVIVPPAAGVFSAFGLLLADIKHELAQGYLAALDDAMAAELGARFTELEHSVAAVLDQEHARSMGRAQLLRQAELRYAGQAHELTVSVPAGPIEISGLVNAFGEEHQRQYGYRADGDVVECVTLRVIGQAALAKPGLSEQAPISSEPLSDLSGREGIGSKPKIRSAYFGAHHGVLDTPVIARAALEALDRKGPLIIEEYDTTVVVPPGWSARRDARDNICLDAEQPP